MNNCPPSLSTGSTTNWPAPQNTRRGMIFNPLMDSFFSSALSARILGTFQIIHFFVSAFFTPFVRRYGWRCFRTLFDMKKVLFRNRLKIAHDTFFSFSFDFRLSFDIILHHAASYLLCADTKWLRSVIQDSFSHKALNGSFHCDFFYHRVAIFSFLYRSRDGRACKKIYYSNIILPSFTFIVIMDCVKLR